MRRQEVIEMPEIGTTEDMARILRLKRRTVYNMVCRKDFRKGIYLGRGRYNLSRLKQCIEESASYLRARKR